MTSVNHVPALTLGLPVYNGEHYLAEALDSVLAQTFTDFELIISDNCSTDRTEEIAREYAARDRRIRFVRHPINEGSAYNHNFVIREARGEFFKWLSDDDLYAPELLALCMDGLHRRPDAVVAHAWTAYLDGGGTITHHLDYPLITDTPDPVTRFRSLLYTQGGDDIYGIIRMSVLKRIPLHGSYHLADRVFVGELSLYGPFFNVPEFLYFRRDHPMRTSRAGGDLRNRCVRLDPARANRLRHPTVRLLAEYVLGYVSAIHRAPISRSQRAACYRDLTIWIARHANPMYRRHLLESPDPAFRAIGEEFLASPLAVAVKRTFGRTPGRRKNAVR